MDARTTAFNGRVAASALRGQVDAEVFSDGSPGQITAAVTDLRESPGGPRMRQVLLGDILTIYDERDGHCFVQSAKDGYCGYVARADVGTPRTPTHRVSARATHAYSAPDIKSAELMMISLGGRLAARSESGAFVETDFGFVPGTHLSPADEVEPDPGAVARRFLGTPYLWGGNSSSGIDCSGLIQAAYLACGLACPGDSDMQRAELGTELPAGSPVLQGDLLFWTGHVALALTPDTLIHATALSMAVVTEDVRHAISRIAGSGDGPLIAHKRP